MPSGDQRSWTLEGSGEFHGDRPTVRGPDIKPGESVSVVEAVLTDERIESYAKFMACDDDPRMVPLWKKQTKQMAFIRAQYLARARVHLQVMGFRVNESNQGGAP